MSTINVRGPFAAVRADLARAAAVPELVAGDDPVGAVYDVRNGRVEVLDASAGGPR